jgi:transposase
MPQGLPPTEEERLAKNAKIAAALRGRKRPGLVKASPTWDLHGAEVEEMVRQGVPVAQIAERTSVKVGTLYDWIKKNGWEHSSSVSPKTNTKTARALDEVLLRVDAGLLRGQVDVDEIAQQCALSIQSVYRIIDKHRAEQWEALKAPYFVLRVPEVVGF